MKGTYKVWEITCKPEWHEKPTYHGGQTITDIFIGTNTDFHKAITNIKEIESGLSLKAIEFHEIGMSYTPAGS